MLGFLCFSVRSCAEKRKKEKNMLTSICGINWGDEGKGRVVDLLSKK